MKGVILAGGKGTRLKPLTDVANKHLLPIYNKPMILYPLDTLIAHDIDDILIVTGGEYVGRFAEYLGDGSEFGVKLTYKIQKEANGIAGALGLAEDFANGEDVMAILGDNVFDSAGMGDMPVFNKHTAHIFVKEVRDPERFGVAVIENGGKVAIEEKPENPKSNLAVLGLYHYPNDVFDVIRTLKPSERGELEITDVNNYYAKADKLIPYKHNAFWSDAGTFDSLLKSANWIKGYE